MQHKLHPVRYRDTMTSAITRLEAIAEDTARPERLTAEFEGMEQIELAACRARLNSLEAVIARWAQDGRSVFDAEAVLAQLLSSEPAPFDLGGNLLERAFYVHFGSQEVLRFNHGYGGAVDGFYIARHAPDTDYELTFVCSGSEWGDLEQRPYAEVLRYASRVACVRAGVGKAYPISFSNNAMKSEPEFLAGDVMGWAKSSAAIVLSILASKVETGWSDNWASVH